MTPTLLVVMLGVFLLGFVAAVVLMSGSGRKSAPGIRRDLPPIAVPPNVQLPNAHDDPRWGEVAANIQAGQKIMAIKIAREITAMGLKEAKDLVEAMEREMGGR